MDEAGIAGPGRDALRQLLHDLRSQSVVVSGFADMLLGQADLLSAAQRHDRLEVIARNARRLTEVVDAWGDRDSPVAAEPPRPATAVGTAAAGSLGDGEVLLIVEDNDDHHELLVGMLRSAMPTARTVRATCLVDAQLVAVEQSPTCCLVDLSLPDAHGLEAITGLRSLVATLPIIVVTATKDERLGMDAVRHGAQDYLVKGRFDGDALRRAITYAVERGRLEATLAHQALYDGLTKLPNRVHFVERLERVLARMDRDPRTVAVFFLDLDGFKDVNDILGHDVGDRLLQAVAERLAATVRRTDTVARLGGDEFTILAEGLNDRADAARLADQLLSVFTAPFPLDETDQFLSASIGVAFATSGSDAAVLLRDADTAMYRAKENGRARSELFDDRLRTRVLERFEIEQGLRVAIPKGELDLHYQQQVDLRTGRAFGAEALLRWQHPKLGFLLPDKFLRVAEDSRLIVPMGRWVLERACADALAWAPTDEGVEPEVWVNVSPHQLERPDFTAVIESTLEATGLDPRRLGIEITETCLVPDACAAALVLGSIRAMGVRVAIDDFGTGYSSLRWLQRLPVDVLKLDQSFVSELGTPDGRTAIVESVITLAHGLGLKVIAEGVETEAQRRILMELGCDEGQGYYFARPRPRARLWDETAHSSDVSVG